MQENRCICCGAVIPEGMQVCPECREEQEKKITRIHPAHTSERRGGRRKNAICFITFYRNLQIYSD